MSDSTMDIHILDGPLRDMPEHAAAAPGSGAVAMFLGVVRGDENGRSIGALDYQVYEPMATRQLEELVRDLISRHGVSRIAVWHSRGRVPVGAVSFRLVVEAPHRKEAIAAMGEFIDRMKADVPIWKTPVWAGGRGG